MKNTLALIACGVLAATGAFAACTGCTTVAGTIYTPNGNTYNGTLLISYPVPFTSADGNYNLIGAPITLTIASGVLSVPLEPNDTASPTGTYYTIKSAVSGLVSLICRVPTSGSPVTLGSICTSTIPTVSTSSLVGSSAAMSATLNFGTIADGSCVDRTFTFSGVTSTTQLQPEWPSTLPAGVNGIMFVSATNTVDARHCNFSGGFVTLNGYSYLAKTSTYALSASASLTFATITDGSCNAQTFTLSGALPGDVVIPTYPSLTAGLSPFMSATAANTITATLCNFSGGTLTPTGTFGAAVAR